MTDLTRRRPTKVAAVSDTPFWRDQGPTGQCLSIAGPSADWNGYLDGAVRSAERVTAEVLAAL